jgi:hypothetical protein
VIRQIRVVPPLALLAVLTACGADVKPNPTNPNYMGAPPGGVTSSMFGEGGLNLFGNNHQKQEEGGALGVNAYLWRGALDTLSFMPLASADPFGGVIITDWYTPPSVTGERFKATAYILGKELRSDGVRISIFHQVLQNGQWVDAPVSQVTVGDIENKVLARARQLREQAVAANG